MATECYAVICAWCRTKIRFDSERVIWALNLDLELGCIFSGIALHGAGKNCLSIYFNCKYSRMVG